MSSPLELRRRLDGMQDRLLGYLRTVVEAESPSNDPEALAHCADVVASLGEEMLGERPVRHEVDGVPQLEWASHGEPAIALIGHFDTVWPMGTVAERPFRVDGEWAYGPGILDMKAGIVQGLAALSVVGLAGVTLLLTGDEEIGSVASQELIERVARRAEAVLVLEPAAGSALKTARKGVANYDLEVLGKEAHAGLAPEDGINATVAVAHLAIAAAALSDPGLATTVTPTTLSAGSAMNTVPGRARLHVDVRAWTGAELARVDAAVRRLDPGVPDARVLVETGPTRTPMEEHHTRALFELAKKAAAAAGLGEITGAAVGGGSDGQLATGVGTPTLDGLGAVGADAHARDERILVAEMVPRATLVAALVEEIRSNYKIASGGKHR